MADTVYYTDSSLRVTEREIILPKRTYPLEQVRSATIQKVNLGVLSFKWGQIWYFWSLYIGARESSRDTDPWRFKIGFGEGSAGIDIGPYFPLLLFIAAIKGFQIYKVFFAKTGQLYLAKLSVSASKGSIVAASLRIDHIQKVVGAINAAMNRSGPSAKDELSGSEHNPDVVPFTESRSGQIQHFLWIDGKVHYANEIKSAEKESMPAHPYSAWLNLASDAATLLIVFALVWTQALPKEDLPAYFLVALSLITPSILTSVYMGWRQWPTAYIVKLKTTTGTQFVFASLDEARVQNVIDIVSASLPFGPKNGYIDDSQVQVDDNKARFGRKTFAVDEIRAVDIRVVRERNERKSRFGIAALVGSIISLPAGYLLAGQGSNIGGYVLMGLSAFLLLTAVALLIMAKQVTYTLTLQGPFGEVEAYTSHSELYVRKIASVLRGVLMRKRENMQVGT